MLMRNYIKHITGGVGTMYCDPETPWECLCDELSHKVKIAVRDVPDDPETVWVGIKLIGWNTGYASALQYKAKRLFRGDRKISKTIENEVDKPIRYFARIATKRQAHGLEPLGGFQDISAWKGYGGVRYISL